jgi:hypothetical protein
VDGWMVGVFIQQGSGWVNGRESKMWEGVSSERRTRGRNKEGFRRVLGWNFISRVDRWGLGSFHGHGS